MSTKILLADDHQLMRQGLRSMLDEQDGLQVIGEADDGRTAVRLARELRPDLVIMDVTMPDLNGIDATRQIRAENPRVKVIARLGMESVMTASVVSALAPARKPTFATNGTGSGAASSPIDA